jgi:hypothetical protein
MSDPSSISGQLLQSTPLQWRRPRSHDSHGPAPVNAMARRPPSLAAMASPLQPLVLTSPASRHGQAGAPPKPLPTLAAMPRGRLRLATGASTRCSSRARAHEPGPQTWPRRSSDQALSPTPAADPPPLLLVTHVPSRQLQRLALTSTASCHGRAGAPTRPLLDAGSSPVAARASPPEPPLLLVSSVTCCSHSRSQVARMRTTMELPHVRPPASLSDVRGHRAPARACTPEGRG